MQKINLETSIIEELPEWIDEVFDRTDHNGNYNCVCCFLCRYGKTDRHDYKEKGYLANYYCGAYWGDEIEECPAPGYTYLKTK